MLKPRVKSVFPPLPPDVETDRHVWHLLRLMDGTRTVEQICAAMRDRDPRLSDDDVRAMLEQLINAGYVEDAAVSDSVDVFGTVDVEELERYRRNVEHFGIFNHPSLSGYDYRLRLRESRVTVLGVDGLGSYAALGLAAAGVGELLLVDGDNVSPDNLNRQVLYTEADIGKPRAEAAAAGLGLINPEVAVSAVSKQTSDVDELRECLRGRNLLVCAAADRRIHGLLNEAALREGTPWLRGTDDGLIATMFLYVPGQTACLECERRAGPVSTAPMYDPCSAPISALIGSVAALEAVKLLSGALEPATMGRKLIFDLRTMNIRFQEVARYADCSDCSFTRG